MQDAFWSTTPHQNTTGSLISLLDSVNHLLNTSVTAQDMMGQPSNLEHLHQLLQELQTITGTLQSHELSGQMTDLNQLLQNLIHSLDRSEQPYASGIGDLHQILDRLKHIIEEGIPGKTHPNLFDPSNNRNRLGIEKSLQSTGKDLATVAYNLQPQSSLELEAGNRNFELMSMAVELLPNRSFDHTSEALSDNSVGGSPAQLLTPTVNSTTSPPYRVAQVMHSCSGVITPDSNNSVIIYNSGAVFWRRGGQVCWVNGHTFTKDTGYFGKLASSLKVFDKNDHYIGYVTPNGCAYTPDGQLFARGGTAIWAAAVLLCNTR